MNYLYDDGSGNYLTFGEAMADRLQELDDAGDPDVAVLRRDDLHPRASDPGAFADADGAEQHFVTITGTDTVEDETAPDDPALENHEFSSDPAADTLHGLWRFDLLPTGTPLARWDAVLGRDLVATTRITSTYRAPAPDGQTHDRVDADPVRLGSSWRYAVFVRDNSSQAFWRLDRR